MMISSRFGCCVSATRWWGEFLPSISSRSRHKVHLDSCCPICSPSLLTSPSSVPPILSHTFSPLCITSFPVRLEAMGMLSFPQRSGEEMSAYLKAELGHVYGNVMQAVDRFVTDYLRGYVMVRGFIEHAAKKVHDEAQRLINEAVKCEYRWCVMFLAHSFIVHLCPATLLIVH